MLSRRHFIITSAALFSQPIAVQAQSASAAAGGGQWARWDAQVTPPNYDPATSNPWGLDPRFLPTRVQANDGLVTGDIYVDAIARYLYHMVSLPHPAGRNRDALRRGHRARAPLRTRRLFDPAQGEMAELAPDRRDDRA